MKIKNLMTLLSGVTGSKSFFGLSVLMFVAFMSFSTTVNAQYVSTPAAIQALKQETLSTGNFKTGFSTPSSKVPATRTPTDYAKSLRLDYVKELLNLVALYGNVSTAIDVNNANWTQRLTGNPGRATSLPVLKAYVINLLRA